MTDDLDGRLQRYLEELCSFEDRHVGGAGNRAANELFAREVTDCGFDVTELPFECLDWERGPSEIRLRDGSLAVRPGPYSMPFDGSGPVRAVQSESELQALTESGEILLVHGELASAPLTPRNYPFYTVESHRRILDAIEALRPAAIVAATPMNPAAAGGLYPFPWIDDGDFKLPHAHVKDVEAPRLLDSDGQVVGLHIDSRPVPSTGTQLVARKPGTGAGRVLFLAHIDSKEGSPGALDNASGVACLLGLARLLRDYRGPLDLEIVPTNGEDYYAASGHMVYLNSGDDFDDVVLGVNVDGAGFTGEASEYSVYGDSTKVARLAREAAETTGLREGEPWVQGDHSVLVMRGIPAVAVTSHNAFFIASTVAHTERDLPELVDPQMLARVARFMSEIVHGAASSAD